jgi:4-hydroxy-3-polyprenylbenzoate decarboxylase
MSAIWGLGQAMFSKCIVVVDEDVNVQDVREVTWKV